MNSTRVESPFTPLSSATMLHQALERSETEPVVLFKHSASCGISSLVRSRITSLAASKDLPIYELVVQESRDLSNELASHFGIQHESPQVIVVHKQQAVFNTSHGRITEKVLRNAAAQASTT